MIWYDIVWYSMVGMVWYDMVGYGVVLYEMMLHGMLYGIVWYGADCLVPKKDNTPRSPTLSLFLIKLSYFAGGSLLAGSNALYMFSAGSGILSYTLLTFF